MDVAEYLVSSHSYDWQYRHHIGLAVRKLEQYNEAANTTNKWDEGLVRRFLILGNTTGTYNVHQKDFELFMANDLERLIQCGKGMLILRQILEVSESRCAPRQEPLLLALALCARFQVRDTQSKKKLPWETENEQEKQFPDAVCRDIRPIMDNIYQRCLQKIALHCVHKVCITPIHLFAFIKYCKLVSATTGLKKDSHGRGRALRSTIINWYYDQTPEHLAMLVTKYRHRVGYSHRDLFCLCHIRPKPSFPVGHNYWQYHQVYDGIFKYVSEGDKKRRKRRLEFLEMRNEKRFRRDPEGTEKLRQEMKQLRLKRVERKKALQKACEQKRAEGASAVHSKALEYINAFEEFRTLVAKDENRAVDLILQYGFVQEHVPPELLKSKRIWGALLRRMPLSVLLKNLSTMRKVGLFDGNGVDVFSYLSNALIRLEMPTSDDRNDDYTNFTGDDPVALVVRRLNNIGELQKSRVNPFTVLLAKTDYNFSCTSRGSGFCEPDKSIAKALDYAFYSSFKTIGVTNKRYILAVDISESMDSFVLGTTVACSQVAATLSMVLIQNELKVVPLAFSDVLRPLEWNKCMSLSEYLVVAKMLETGNTDCALPLFWAVENQVEADVFIVFTDNNISVKTVEPSEALSWYRQKLGIMDAKLIVVAMTIYNASTLSTCNPDILFIYGMDASVPQLIHDFALGL